MRGGVVEGGRKLARHVAWIAGLVLFAGCGGGSTQHAPQVAPSDAVTPPAQSSESGQPTTGQPNMEPVPTNAATDPLATGWLYRFDMTSPPNDNFAIRDRNFHVFFKPDTSAVFFQIENRRGVATRILWDECTFVDIYGRTSRAVHRGIPYDRRNQPQEATWLQPNQRYSDYLIPVDLLNDPLAATGSGQRLLLPTDSQAQSMVGRVFGCNLVLGGGDDNVRVEYDARFKVVSTYRE
jgi:hypothetical protein